MIAIMVRGIDVYRMAEGLQTEGGVDYEALSTANAQVGVNESYAQGVGWHFERRRVPSNMYGCQTCLEFTENESSLKVHPTTNA